MALTMGAKDPPGSVLSFTSSEVESGCGSALLLWKPPTITGGVPIIEYALNITTGARKSKMLAGIT